MATIEEKINKMVCTRLQEHQSKMGYNEGINIEYFATDCAIEQDRIARQEERERCIKVITEMLNDPYEYYSVDGYTHNEYVDEDKIREAIENENE